MNKLELMKTVNEICKGIVTAVYNYGESGPVAELVGKYGLSVDSIYEKVKNF